MATLKRRLHKKNATGYDTIHFETESDLVLLSDGTTLTNKLKSIDSSIAAKLPLSGGTLTGNLNGQYFTGTLLQTISATDLGRTCNKICVLDESGWIYYRTPAELLSDAGGAKSSHTHDDRYYTETEVNSFLNNKANTNHTHSGYATTSALNSLTTRVTSLEGSVDMAKLVYTFGGNCNIGGDIESKDGTSVILCTYSAAYCLIRPAYIHTIDGNTAPIENNHYIKIMKGCTGSIALPAYVGNSKSGAKEEASIHTFTYNTNGTLTLPYDYYDNGYYVHKVYFHAEFYNQ